MDKQTFPLQTTPAYIREQMLQVIEFGCGLCYKFLVGDTRGTWVKSELKAPK